MSRNNPLPRDSRRCTERRRRRRAASPCQRRGAGRTGREPEQIRQQHRQYGTALRGEARRAEPVGIDAGDERTEEAANRDAGEISIRTTTAPVTPPKYCHFRIGAVKKKCSVRFRRPADRRPTVPRRPWRRSCEHGGRLRDRVRRIDPDLAAAKMIFASRTPPAAAVHSIDSARNTAK